MFWSCALLKSCFYNPPTVLRHQLITESCKLMKILQVQLKVVLNAIESANQSIEPVTIEVEGKHIWDTAGKCFLLRSILKRCWKKQCDIQPLMEPMIPVSWSLMMSASALLYRMKESGVRLSLSINLFWHVRPKKLVRFSTCKMMEGTCSGGYDYSESLTFIELVLNIQHTDTL